MNISEIAQYIIEQGKRNSSIDSEKLRQILKLVNDLLSSEKEKE